jgi:DNA-binding IclR family transcriptional regulator
MSADAEVPASAEESPDTPRVRLNGSGRIPTGPRMPAVRNSVAVLRRLAASAKPLPASALARALGIPRSSTYQLLQVLIDEGLVAHVPESRSYALSVGVFELGSAYLRHQPLEHLARPLLGTLAKSLGETAQLGILQGPETLYLLKEQPERTTALVTDVGVRLPAHLTASGRSMLSGLPQKEVMAFFSRPGSFTRMTEEGPRNLRELRQLLAADAERGWSLERGSVTEGITCIAAPARDHSGRPVASVVMSFRSERHENDVDQVAAAVLRAARELTRRLGGRPAES